MRSKSAFRPVAVSGGLVRTTTESFAYCVCSGAMANKATTATNQADDFLHDIDDLRDILGQPARARASLMAVKVFHGP